LVKFAFGKICVFLRVPLPLRATSYTDLAEIWGVVEYIIGDMSP